MYIIRLHSCESRYAQGMYHVFMRWLTLKNETRRFESLDTIDNGDKIVPSILQFRERADIFQSIRTHKMYHCVCEVIDPPCKHRECNTKLALRNHNDGDIMSPSILRSLCPHNYYVAHLYKRQNMLAIYY